ncbi:MAG: hypothetical protein HKN74_02550 [Acidimicrobiia bacterium]|nr:hypothetical protein [Acidimicrobiia bacterium]MBT8217142.1 hypothetical protein [Acidimicrobiia bacterium]NNF09143.1 hypothetical protein [Acidimicrobiia bacterium]NNL70490.1 hypothetical protein [Acidimicrobiia bacterium]
MKPNDPTLDALKEVLADADGAPADVIQAAKDSFTWRTVDAELASLVFDSATDDLATVRGGTVADRQLTYQAGDVEIEVMVSGNHISGQLIPPRVGHVELAAGAELLEARVDELGSFTFPDVPSGPVRLTIRVGDQTIATEWTIV